MIEPIYDECEECPNCHTRLSSGMTHGLDYCLGNQGYPLPDWCPVKKEEGNERTVL